MKRYLTCAETAALVRRALARDFPGVKFSVRSSVYAGGASIRVGYDGIAGYAPLTSCWCLDTGPTVRVDDPHRCTTCGYVGRSVPVYRPGMPTHEAVEAVVWPYSGRGFDGMIDLAYPISRWLTPDGRIVGTVTPGSRGSGGMHPAIGDVAPDGAVLVSPGASYIFVEAQ